MEELYNVVSDENVNIQDEMKYNKMALTFGGKASLDQYK